MKRFCFFLAAFCFSLGLQNSFAEERATNDSATLFWNGGAIGSNGPIDLASAEHISLSLLRPTGGDRAVVAREDQDFEAVEDRAPPGPDDTAPILDNPKPTFQAQTRAALTTVTAFPKANAASGSTEAAALNAGPSWIAIGPSPIPNGQTDPANANGISTTQSPVSGRTTAIAVDPTDPNIAYVGTAQGGLYRTTNGGANWTPL